MRFFLLIFLLLAVCIDTSCQIQQPVFVGISSWEKVANQKSPDPLPVTEHKVWMNTTVYPDENKSIVYRKIDPGTILLKNGPTLPLVQSFNITGRKLAAPNIVDALPLETRDNADFNISYTDKQHGYAGSNSSDFAEDEKHNIWIASGNELIKYDGYHYYKYNTKNGFPDITIESMAYDNQHRLWLGSNKGVYYIKNDSLFTIKSKGLDFSTLYCRKVTVDNKQRIWFATKENGAICLTKTSLLIYDKRCGLPFDYVHTTFIDKDGNILLGLWDKGLIIIKPDKMLFLFSKTKLMQYHDITAIYQDDQGIWLGGFTSSLLYMGSKDTLQYSTSGGNYNERIYDIKKAPKGLWISIYGGGLCYFSKERIIHFSQTNGLLSNNTYYLFEDSFQNIWVADLLSGFSRLNESNFYLEPYPNKNINLVYNKIPDKKRKGEWIFTEGSGLSFYSNSKLTAYMNTLQNGIQPMMHPMYGELNEDGSLWISSYGAGIVYAKNQNFEFYQFADFWENQIIFSIKKDHSGKVFFSTMRYGVIVYDQQAFWHYSTATGLGNDEPLKLFTDGNKKVCCSFKNLFQRFNGSNIENLQLNKKVFNQTINDYLSINESISFLGTEGSGLYIQNKEKVYQLTTVSGLLSNNIKNITKDTTGKIWLTTDKGIEYLKFKGMEITEHKIFSQSNGSYLLNGGQVILNPNGFPTWSAGKKQLQFDPVFSHPENKTPYFNFGQALIDTTPLPYNEPISIIPNKKINIPYSIIYWGRENNLEIYYLLVSNRGDTTKRFIGDKGNIAISEILPGQYRIILAAIDNKTIFYAEPIFITVNNYWYNTWLFRVLLGILVILGIIRLFRIKSKRQRQQNEILKEKVAQQTEEIRKEKEELIQSNQVINKQMEEKDVLIQEINHRVKNNLQFIAAMVEMQMGSDFKKGTVESLLGTSRRIAAMSLVHEMLYDNKDTQGLSVKKYISELVSHLKEMAIDNSNPIQINMDVEDILLDSKSAIALGMIISELVSNSFKHAFTNIANPVISIQLKLDIASGNITVTVSDNGNGISISNEPTKGLGSRLVDIFSRQLEGSHTIHSDHHFVFVLIFKPQQE